MEHADTERDSNRETTTELRKDIDMLAQKFDSHREESRERWDKITDTTEINALNITKAVDAMNKQTESTQGLVEAWTAANGFYKVVKWVSGLSGAGILAAYLADKFGLAHFFK